MLNISAVADAVEKIDRVSTRLLLGLLLPGLLLLFLPSFASFRANNAHWFPATMLMLAGILAGRGIWWLGAKATESVRRSKELAELALLLETVSPQEAVLLHLCVSTQRQTIMCDKYDPGAQALLTRDWATASNENEHRYPLIIHGWVWRFLMSDPERWQSTFDRLAGNCTPHVSAGATVVTGTRWHRLPWD